MPGETWMVTHLQVGRDTVRAAMEHLQEEGVLAAHGQGRCREIVMNRPGFKAQNFKVRILLYQKEDRGDIDNSSLLAQLLEAGFDAGYSVKTLKDLGMRVDRVARHVHQNPANAWVISAASREIIEWFSGQPTPAIAMYGRAAELPIAAAFTFMIPGQTAVLRRLIELGHKRIVMLARGERRHPELSRPEQAFLDELEAAGIQTGRYNLPDWEESRAGLRRCLDGLFLHSAPTALFFLETPIFIAARAHLADRGIVAPGMSRWWCRIGIPASPGATPSPPKSAGITARWCGAWWVGRGMWRAERATAGKSASHWSSLRAAPLWS